MKPGWLRLFAVLSGVCAVAVFVFVLNAEAASAFLHCRVSLRHAGA